MLLSSNLIYLERVNASDSIWTKNEATIKNGETVVIENVNKTTKTDFIIEEGGTLIIKNSSLFMTGKHHHDNYIEVYGTLIIENSEIHTEIGLAVDIKCWSPQASIIIRDSDLIKKEGKKDGGNIIMECGVGKVNIIHSDITSLFLFPMEGKYDNLECYVESSSMKFFNLGIGEGSEHIFEDLSPDITEFNYSKEGINVRMKNIKILQDLIIDVHYTTKKKQVVIKNSSVGLVVRGGSDIEVIDSTLLFLELKSGESYHYKNLHPGYYKDQVLIDKPSCKIKLINSEIRGKMGEGRIGINISFGENIIVEDCELSGLKINHNLIARNAIVDYLQIYENEGGILQFENVELGTMEFVITAEVTIKGSLSIGEKEVFLWGGLKTMRIERFFPVIVRDQNGDPISNASLTLYNSSGTLIWEGKTDSNGKSEFSIVFNKNNYKKTFLLKVESPNYKTEKNITLTSNTPIMTNSSEDYDVFSYQESDQVEIVPNILFKGVEQQIKIIIKDKNIVQNGKARMQVTYTNDRSILGSGFEIFHVGTNLNGDPQINAYIHPQLIDDHYEIDCTLKPSVDENVTYNIRSGNGEFGYELYFTLHEPPETTKNLDLCFVYSIDNVPIICGKNSYDLVLAKNYYKSVFQKDKDFFVILGGPVANDLTKKLMEKFSKEISNKYPGTGKGIIEVKEIGGVTYVLLAGSDRDGTNAAVQIFLELEKLPDKSIIVDWNNGDPKIIEE